MLLLREGHKVSDGHVVVSSNGGGHGEIADTDIITDTVVVAFVKKTIVAIQVEMKTLDCDGGAAMRCPDIASAARDQVI